MKIRPLGIALLLALLLHACGGGGGNPGGGPGPGDPPPPPDTSSLTLRPGETQRTAQLFLQAFPASFTGTLMVTLASASELPPLPGGLTRAGDPLALSGRLEGGAPGGAPLLIGLPLPTDLDPSEAAIALFDPLSLAVGAGTGPLPASDRWMVLQTAYEATSRLLIAPIYDIGPEAVVVVVRWPRAQTPTVTSVAPQSATLSESENPGFTVVCRPEFDVPSATESCSQAARNNIASVLEAGYLRLRSDGYRQPRLERVATIAGTVTAGLQLTQGDYRAWLRPLSQVSGTVLGVYSSGPGSFWVGIGNAGVTNLTREVARHELFHAFQFAYNTRHAELWVLEGQTSIVERDYGVLQRSLRALRTVEEPFATSNVAGNFEYRAQDFWIYLAMRFGATDSTFLLPFVNRGFTAADIDATLRATYPGAFGGAGNRGGLPAAYWDWARNQVLENQVVIEANRPDPCSILRATAPTVIDLADPAADLRPSVNLDPLASVTYRLINGRTNSHTLANEVSLALSNGHSDVRTAVYPLRANGCDDVAIDTTSHRLRFDADQRSDVLVLVANSSFSAARSASLTVNQVTIEAPQVGLSRRPEGVLEFRARSAGSNGLPARITLTLQPTDGGTPFIIGPIPSGTTVSQVVCDGDYDVTAEARTGAGLPSYASHKIRIRVDDTSDTVREGPCAPRVSIVEPTGSGTFATNSTISFRAEASAGGERTPRLEWFIQGPFGWEYLGSGANLNQRFSGPGTYTVRATYGAANDTVAVTVRDGSPPTVAILTPADGSRYRWDTSPTCNNGNGTAVRVGGLASQNGVLLPASALAWSLRRAGATTWTPLGDGAVKDICFDWGGTLVNQGYDVRLIATNSAGLQAISTIRLTIQRPPD